MKIRCTHILLQSLIMVVQGIIFGWTLTKHCMSRPSNQCNPPPFNVAATVGKTLFWSALGFNSMAKSRRCILARKRNVKDFGSCRQWMASAFECVLRGATGGGLWWAGESGLKQRERRRWFHTTTLILVGSKGTHLLVSGTGNSLKLPSSWSCHLSLVIYRQPEWLHVGRH